MIINERKFLMMYEKLEQKIALDMGSQRIEIGVIEDQILRITRSQTDDRVKQKAI